MNLNNVDWLEIAVLRGMQRLSCLSLDRTPAAEILPGTAQAWTEALTEDRDWNEARDAERVRKAFVTLARVSRRWPSIPEFTEALPPVPPPAAIGYERKPASPESIERARKAVEALAAGAVLPMPAAKLERDTTPEQREQIERELEQHYDRKRAAGGDA